VQSNLLLEVTAEKNKGIKGVGLSLISSETTCPYFQVLSLKSFEFEGFF
jgi:hypothetical protein